MSDSAQPSPAAADAHEAPPASPNAVVAPPAAKRSFRQFGLRAFFLLTAAVAVWIAYDKNRRESAHFKQQIEAMRPLAHELIVVDPAQYAVVKQDERWYDQNDWRLYLPRGTYRVCVATHAIDQNGIAPQAKSAAITAGEHVLTIETERNDDKSWRTIVTADGAELLRVDEPAEWNEAHGSSGGGDYNLLTQRPTTEPLVLFRRRFTVLTTPNSYSTPTGPCNGILLWIEAEK